MPAKNPATMFKPGESGNPAGPKPKRPRGRPKGALSSPSSAIRKAISAHADELIDALLKASRAGDLTATCALVDRIVPRLRSVAPAVTVNLAGSREEAFERILNAVSAGDLDAPAAAELFALIRDARGDDPPKFEPMDTEKLNAIYVRALEHAESERLRIRRDIEEGRRGGEPEQNFEAST